MKRQHPFPRGSPPVSHPIGIESNLYRLLCLAARRAGEIWKGRPTSRTPGDEPNVDQSIPQNGLISTPTQADAKSDVFEK